jgi:hypothetical protein
VFRRPYADLYSLSQAARLETEREAKFGQQNPMLYKGLASSEMKLEHMNPRHAAALALVGWYLMVPPISVQDKE